jgi:hypothetical protein
VSVKPYSAAYFKLLDLLPELQQPLTVGERVRISGRAMMIAISPTGVEQLSNADIAMIKKLW